MGEGGAHVDELGQRGGAASVRCGQPRHTEQQRYTHHQVEVRLLLPLPVLAEVVSVVRVQRDDRLALHTFRPDHLQQLADELVDVAH